MVPYFRNGAGGARGNRIAVSTYSYWRYRAAKLSIEECIDLAAEAGFDGSSLRPLLEGRGDLDRSAVYFHYPHYHASGSVPSAAIRSGEWKLIHFFEKGTSELYRLSDDIGELNNLAPAMPERAGALERQLLAWLASVDAQMPTVNAERR